MFAHLLTIAQHPIHYSASDSRRYRPRLNDARWCCIAAREAPTRTLFEIKLRVNPPARIQAVRHPVPGANFLFVTDRQNSCTNGFEALLVLMLRRSGSPCIDLSNRDRHDLFATPIACPRTLHAAAVASVRRGRRVCDRR